MTNDKMQPWRETAPAELSAKAQQLVDEVRLRAERAKLTGQSALDKTLEFLNETRELGLTIETAKGQLGRAQWHLATGYFPFNEQQVQGLLNFARKHPEPIKDMAEVGNSLADAQLALGFGEYPSGHGPQTIHDHNFALEMTKSVTAFVAKLKKEIARSPIETWTPSYAQQFVQINQPLVSNLSAIVDEAARRAA